MHQMTETHEFVETDAQFRQFLDENRNVEWMGFDTEFVGERRFFTTICLIQIATENGIYLVDPFEVKDWSPLLELLGNPKIRKITHAGDNDYRLLYNQFGVTPKNVVDTQIAGAFIGYKYPVAFRKLLENELQVFVDKGFTVADWESRPLKKKQLIYAIQDVKYLKELWFKIEQKLVGLGRMEWALNECKSLETSTFYDIDPDKEALDNNLIKGLSEREQIFLIRLFRWRRDTARQKNQSKEMVLPGKLISTILKAIPGGLDALEHNRRIPTYVTENFGALLEGFYENPALDDEKNVLKNIPAEKLENSRQDILLDMLDMAIKLKCLDENIAHEMVLPRNLIKKLKLDGEFFDPALETGWRSEFLGEEIIRWMKNRTRLDLKMGASKLEFGLNS